MLTASASSANQLWLEAREFFRVDGRATGESGRTGSVQEVRPVLLSLLHPQKRWVLSRVPVINPAAVAVEVIWIMNGRRDAGMVNHWNPALPRFAGSDAEYHGAYGYRLRRGYGFDQLARAAEALTANPTSRQVCLAIWDPRLDLPNADGVPRADDIPCNVFSMLKVRNGALDWTQVMRSNDFWLGLPFNIVQFTYLQEILASWMKLDVGVYYHFSDSLHLYQEHTEANASLTPVPDPLENDMGQLAPAQQNESDEMFLEMATRLDIVASGSMKASDFPLLRAPAEWPAGYRDLLNVALADAARRAGEDDLAGHVGDMLVDTQLRIAWGRWVDRQKSTAR